MSRYLLMLLFLIANYPVFGQIDGFDVDKHVLEGFEKIIVSNFSGPDSLYSYGEYYLSNGLIDRMKGFNPNGELKYYKQFEYWPNGKLKTECSFSQVYVYDEKSGADIPTWMEGRYLCKKYFYSDSSISRIEYHNFWEGEDEFEFEIYHKYDDQGRIIQKFQRQLVRGFYGNFVPNTTELDTTYIQNTGISDLSTYTYVGDSVIMTEFDQSGNITGYISSVLEKEQPIRTYYLSENGEIFLTYIFRYNENRQLIFRKRTILNEHLINFDTIAGDNYKITYNSDGLPEKASYFEEDQLLYYHVIEYIKRQP